MSDSREKSFSKWEFSWPTVDVMIGGQSAVDLKGLSITQQKEAEIFLLRYGYNCHLKHDQFQMHAMVIEALSFIERYLMPREWAAGLKPPNEIMKCTSPAHLILWASDYSAENKSRRIWACALLRILHTISHLDAVRSFANMDAARDQIMSRFHEFLFRDENNRLWLGKGDNRVELEKVEWKDQKTRESIILKLLHKKGNVAETIHDLLGVRFVTKRLCDVMLVIKYLREFHLITFPNTNPTRSRNSLLDLERFQTDLATLNDMLKAQVIGEEEFNRMLERLTMNALPNLNRSNPHSSNSYRAIQLTCRQLVRTQKPSQTWIPRINDYFRSLDQEQKSNKEVQALIRFMDGVQAWPGVKDEIEDASFVPFEVQVMDHSAYIHNQYGEASHDRYKKSQIRAARRRVLCEVLGFR